MFTGVKVRLMRTMRAMACWGLAIGLAACATPVPRPTGADLPSGRLSALPAWHNIGPQRLQRAEAVAFADLNGDGRLDLVVGGEGGVRVWLGDGKGRWLLAPSPATGMRPKAIVAADFDRDGAVELAFVGGGDEKGVQLWHRTKHGWRRMVQPVENGRYRALVALDLNGDGWLDLAAAKDGGIDLWLNDAEGGWVPGAGPVREGDYAALAGADLNGDGAPDLIAVRRDGMGAARAGSERWLRGGIELWWNDGEGRWRREVLPLNDSVLAVLPADFDGDGVLDLAIGYERSGVELLWLRKAEAGIEVASRRRLVRRGAWKALAFGDLDGDGAKELVAGSSDGMGLRVWRIERRSARAVKGWLPPLGSYMALALGDVFGDGRMNVAAARIDGAPEVWSHRAAAPLPLAEVDGELIDEAVVFFESASDALTDEARGKLARWWQRVRKRVGENRVASLRFELIGKADQRPLRSHPRFRNNLELSRARAEAVARWLQQKGVSAARISVRALGASEPEPPGLDPEALRQNRRVRARAILPKRVKLLPKIAREQHEDLFHVKENKVFRTINGRPLYKVGPGDELEIVFWRGGKSEKHKVIVQLDGTVSLPYLEALKVADLTAPEIDQKITRMLARLERHPRVDVRVLKKRSKVVTIFGEVQSLLRQPTGPGSYYLRGKETIVDFLSRAGGPTKEADLTKVQLIRGGRTIVLNLERAIQQGDWTENAVLDDGDRIVIPSLRQSKRRVYVLGEVKKPGVVEFTGEIHFLDAIAKAGGFGEDAYLKDIRVLRANRSRPEILPVAFDRLVEKGDLAQNIALQDKDIIIVPRSPIGNWNAFIRKLMPSFQLLTLPLTAVQEVLLIRDLSRRLRR